MDIIDYLNKIDLPKLRLGVNQIGRSILTLLLLVTYMLAIGAGGLDTPIAD